jgi:hypothetical protein
MPDDLSTVVKASLADFMASTPDPRINRRTIAAALRGEPIMGPEPRGIGKPRPLPGAPRVQVEAARVALDDTDPARTP